MSKHHGLGNDFLIALAGALPADAPAMARAVCHRTRGVGADGLIFGLPGDAGAGTGPYHRAVIDELGIPGRYPEALPDLEEEPDPPVLHRLLAELHPRAAPRLAPSNRRRIVPALEVTG